MPYLADCLLTRHNRFMQFGIKNRVLLLALMPAIAISALLLAYFVSTRLQDLQESVRTQQGKVIASKLKSERELETKSMRSREYQILIHASLIFLLGLSLSALLAYRMGRSLTQPILAIAEAVKKIREGALNTRIPVSTYPELKMLGSGINSMAEALENAHQELHHKVEQATLSLRRTLETIEVQNIELEISRRAAESANKVKSEFLADMSHEIRTPLNGVVGFIQLLQKTELNQKQQEYARTIQTSANNLLAILNDILDFSKMEAGKLRIERSVMDIRDCIEETLNLLAANANEKNITLIPLIYADIPRHIVSDPLRIKQIITNLVSNAIKFTEKGSVIIRVILEDKALSQATIRIQITDTGIGLSEEEQKILFQAFNQTKRGFTHKFGGTGLGLVICKKLVEQMGGSIGVESAPQKGATFWFTFQAELYKDTSTTITLPTPIFSGTPAKPLQSISVLAVDDNPENLKLIRILLEDMGIQVTTAPNGKTAINAIHQTVFDLILMDIRMPDMNGIEASKAIRDIEKTHHRKPTPIIALTAYALSSEKDALLKTGVNDYLTKPIGEKELNQVLQKWIQPQSRVIPVVDWVLSKQLAGGRIELAQEFFEKLTLSLPKDKAQINAAYLRSDWRSLRDYVHKLHGACCYCGVLDLKECAKKLEATIASGLLDNIKPDVDALNLAIDAVLAEASSLSICN
jgi:two-component system sensor histidine kinase BarA